MRKEGDNWIDGSSTESIVTQVELDEGGFVFESIADRGKREWNFRDQTTSEDISKICDLSKCFIY